MDAQDDIPSADDDECFESLVVESLLSVVQLYVIQLYSFPLPSSTDYRIHIIVTGPVVDTFATSKTSATKASEADLALSLLDYYQSLFTNGSAINQAYTGTTAPICRVADAILIAGVDGWID